MSTRVVYRNCFYNVPDEYDKIPFGKYHGKPVTVLLDDPSYLKWLLSTGFDKAYPELIESLETGEPVDPIEWLKNHSIERNKCKSKVKVPHWLIDYELDEEKT